MNPRDRLAEARRKSRQHRKRKPVEAPRTSNENGELDALMIAEYAANMESDPGEATDESA